MGRRGSGQRLRALLFTLALPVLLGLSLATSAAAQDTTRTPVDTLRSDTLAVPPPPVPRDTTRRDTTLRDTTQRDTTRRDTMRRRRETLSEADVLGFDVPPHGRLAAGRRLPVLDPAIDATALLGRVPGAFRYDLGGVGWPHGISFQGLPPDETALLFDGLPFDDLLTGRPRYDLLPLPFLSPLREGPGDVLGATRAVHARLRPYAFGRPLTVLRYRSGGMQSIGALHTQRRQLRFFDVPAVMKFTGGYFGRAAENLSFLPNSRLESERRLVGRVRYRRPTWALQLTALHNRRTLGANGGIDLLPGDPIAAAFAGRPTRFPQAERRFLRTDLAATLRLRTPLARRPLTAAVYRTTQTVRYRNPALTDARPADDTLSVEIGRLGLRLAQTRVLDTERLGRHALALEAHAWADGFEDGNALPEGDARTEWHLTARDSVRLFPERAGVSALLEAGLHGRPLGTYPSARLRLQHTGASLDADSIATATPDEPPVRFFAEAYLAGQRAAWIEDAGFGGLVEPLGTSQTPGPVLGAEAGGETRLGPVALRLTVFGRRTIDRLDLQAVDDSALVARAVLAGRAFQETGGTLSARWRFEVERGFYATASATGFLGSANGSLIGRAGPAVPRAHGQGQLGARYALFTDDLSLDAYVRGRFWTAMRGRALHTPTGRLVTAPPGSPTLGPGGVVDLHAEAKIRDATLFFSYEHALGDISVQTAAFNVPVYPLPSRQFRFGVYWPIFN